MRYRAAAALVAAALIASAATPAAADADSSLVVTGVVVVMADGAADLSTSIVAGNTVIPVAPDAVDGLPSGTEVAAELAIPDATARELGLSRDVAAESALGEAVVEAVDAPLEAESVDVIRAAAAAPETGVHQVDVAINVADTRGHPQPSESQVRAAMAEISSYWSANTDGALPGIAVRSVKLYASAIPCSRDSDEAAFVWAEEAAALFDRDALDYFVSEGEHLAVIGECVRGDKAAIGTVGASIASGGFVMSQADFFPAHAPATYLSGLLAHEFGHNFGLNHSNALDLSGCSVAGTPRFTDITACPVQEYADDWSIMGFATPMVRAPLLDVARRDQLGVSDETTLATHGDDTYATYVLKPLGAATGLKGIKVDVPSATYYVEYRDGTGEPDAQYLADGGCTGEWQPSATCTTNISPEGPGVRILRLDDEGATTVRAARTLDAYPNFAEMGFDAGDEWRTATGDVSVRVVTAAGGAAKVVVSTGTPPKVQFGGVRLSAAPAVGRPITVYFASTTPAGAAVTYRWLRDGKAIPGATGPTYTPAAADAGTRLTAELTGTSDDAATGIGKFTASVIPTKPVLAEPVRVGAPASAPLGTWPAGFSLTYQWLRAGSPIAGATSETYVPTASDYGKALSLRVTGTHATLGSVPVTSAAVTVAAGVLTAPVPTIDGTAKVGSTLTAVRGTWTAGTTFTYRWYANGSAISGATAKSFTVPSSLAGKKVTVKVTGKKTAYATKSVTSAAVGVPIVGKPTITGTAKVGSRLTARPGTWTSGTTFAYRWYAGGVAVEGATSSTMTLASAQAGKVVTVKVTGTKAGYTTVTKTSPGTAVIKR